MTAAILVINAGSSSIKFSLFAATRQPGETDLICGGRISGIGGHPQFVATAADGRQLVERGFDPDVEYDELIAALVDWLEGHLGPARLIAAGHRIVHGGRDHVAPERLDARLIDSLRALEPLAPLHQPHNLDAVAALSRRHPGLSQIACFDTAFHAAKPEVESIYALPNDPEFAAIRRYGFHGLSYQHIAERLSDVLGDKADGRVIVAHLGSGASLCAMRNRESVATTMGFTALDGLPMGTRCGQLDPGVVLYLMDERGMSSKQVAELLYTRSGLRGMSGISNDMRDLLESDDPAAIAAIDYFCHRVNREIGSLAAAIGGLDVLVFTAGIGENAPEIRSRICRNAAWLGIGIDEAANRKNASVVSPEGQAVCVAVIPANEELVIARQTWEVVSAIR